MTDKFTLRLDGLDELLRELDKLEARFQKRNLMKALAHAGRLMRKAAREEAPVLDRDKQDDVHTPGDLRRSIAVKKLTRLGLHSAAVVVGPRLGGRDRNSRGSHGHLVEKGTKAHAIKLKRKKGRWQHPGSEANPFMRRAFERTKSEAEKMVIKKLEEMLYG